MKFCFTILQFCEVHLFGLSICRHFEMLMKIWLWQSTAISEVVSQWRIISGDHFPWEFRRWCWTYSRVLKVFCWIILVSFIITRNIESVSIYLSNSELAQKLEKYCGGWNTMAVKNCCGNVIRICFHDFGSI